MSTLTKENILSIAKLRKEKNEDGSPKTNAQIAKELGVSESTVIRWAKRLRESGRDVPIRKGGLPKIEL